MSKFGTAIKNTFRPSPFHYVLFIACAVVFLSVGGRYYFGAGGGLDVQFRERKAREATAQQKSSAGVEQIYSGDDSAQSRYSLRLRDASQLAVALGLFTVRSRTGFARIHTDIEAVMDGLKTSPLLPPSVTSMRVIKFKGGADQRGEFLTQTGAYYVAYRARPLAFEILAAGQRGVMDGAVFVVRLPEATGTIQRGQQAAAAPGSYATVFIAPNRNAVVPIPFSPPDVYRAAGWGQEPLRSAPFSPQEAAEVNRFLADVSGQ